MSHSLNNNIKIMLETYFAKNYTGHAFELFSRSHLTALGFITLIILMLGLMRLKNNQRVNRGFRIAVATILILQEISYHIWNVYIGEWTIQRMLPFHLCSVFVWLSAVMLITRNRRTFEFAYFLGISGALQALATPDLGEYGIPHYRFFHMFTSHGSILLASLYMAIVEGWRPYWRSMVRVIVWLNGYGILVFIINLAIGSNYLYINHKPPTASLFDVLGPWPVYVIAAEGIAIVMFILLYLPYIVKDWKPRRANV